jgi:hypothetical protein
MKAWEHVYRRDGIGMIASEGLPGLRRWPPFLCHVFCDRRLADIDAKLEQLAVNPWRSSQRVVTLISRMSWRMSTGVFSRPPHDREFPGQYGRKPARCQRSTVYGSRIFTASSTLGDATEPDKQQSIDVADGHSLRRFAA